MGKKTKYARHLRAGLIYVRTSHLGTVEISPNSTGYAFRFRGNGDACTAALIFDRFSLKRLPACLRRCSDLLGKPSYSKHFIMRRDGTLQPLDPETGDFVG